MSLKEMRNVVKRTQLNCGQLVKARENGRSIVLP